ncbi:thiaminase II [Solirubrobacter soli]|uniref:thiaminase II n=1 Tax=Solirubrobacter soli TaxID=363832 RepID=UPI001B7FB9A1|nr:thiaminase II [Solirubrobacter soli]
MSHPFVRELGDGSLDEAAFRFYIRQDYLFLVDYGRLLSLGAARAPRLADMRKFAGLASSVLETEMELHRAFAARWGVDDLHAVTVEPATAAYCDFLLRVAALGDYAELTAAVLPCMWTYAEIGASLKATSDRYREWIDMYASPEFASLADWARGIVDEVSGDFDRMSAAFTASCEHEVRFWDAAYAARGPRSGAA